MKYFQIFYPVLSLIFSLLVCKSEPLPKEDQSCVPKSISTSTELRCGGVITQSSGYISYKPYQLIDKNERCVWTLGFQDSYRYDIDIQYLGFSNSNQSFNPQPSLIISTTPVTGISPASVFIPTTTGVFNFTARAAIITFSSGHLEGHEEYTGFILKYTRSYTGAGSTTYHKIVMPRIMVNFTADGYSTSNSLGTLVFPPENNTYPGTPYPIVYMEYGSTTCSASCTIRLDVFHFDRSNTTAPWQFVEELCCSQQTAIIPGHDDLWMITVRASLVSVKANFILFNERCR